MPYSLQDEQLLTISETRWVKDHAAILAQARLFQSKEKQRLRTTTLKVQIYLGLLIATPAATATVLKLGDGVTSQDPTVLGFLLIVVLCTAAFFWIVAMWQGHKALSVGTYSFMDVGDFKQAAEASKPSSILIAKILEITVLNQSMHNEKIANLKRMERSIFRLVSTLCVGLVGSLFVALWPYIMILYAFVKCTCS